MILIYSLIAASACSLYYALFDIWRTLAINVEPPDPDFPIEVGVGAPKRPPLGSLDAYAIPEIDGRDSSFIP